MSDGRGATAAAALLLLLAASPLAAQDAYPSDIAPPPGTRYPCALTALPPGLPGVPAADRAYLNRTYARILRAAQAKLVLLKALEESRGIEARLAGYAEQTSALAGRQERDSVPAGLEPFQQDVLAALVLQQAFFPKAAALRQASTRLVAAGSRMQARYPGWPPGTRDSIYHHLCALDLF